MNLNGLIQRPFFARGRQLPGDATYQHVNYADFAFDSRPERFANALHATASIRMGPPQNAQMPGNGCIVT